MATITLGESAIPRLPSQNPSHVSRLLAERLNSRRMKFMWGPADNLTIGEFDSAIAGFQHIRPYLHSLHL